MKAEEIAKALYERMYYKMPLVLSEKRKHETAKQCALICVDEILKLELNDGYDHDFYTEVKNEIEKL